MLFIQEFKIDKVDIKHARHPEEVIESIKSRRAEELGEEIVKIYPYKLNEEKSYKGELPESVLNREHQFVDHYEQRLFIFSEEQLLSMIKQFESEAEELIQERDNEDEGYLRLAKANLLKYLTELS